MLCYVNRTIFYRLKRTTDHQALGAIRTMIFINPNSMGGGDKNPILDFFKCPC